MEFNYDCESLLGCDTEGVAIIEPSHKNFVKYYTFISMSDIIDSIGSISSVVSLSIFNVKAKRIEKYYYHS